MNKKYFFFDIDGTLTDPKTTELVPSAIEALRKLKENGHFVAISTGRAEFYARPIMEKLGIDNMVCYGGAGLVVKNKLIRCVPLQIEKMRKLFHDCENNNVPYLLQLDNTDTLYGKYPIELEKIPKFSKTGCIIDKNMNIDNIDNIYKAYVFVTKEDEYKVKTLQETSKLRYSKDFYIIQYDEKKQGIIDMMNYLKADIKDVVVFGDDTNDLVMFADEWFSIAMGNGVQELKDKANYVTDNSVDDGVYKACEHFGWI